MGFPYTWKCSLVAINIKLERWRVTRWRETNCSFRYSIWRLSMEKENTFWNVEICTEHLHWCVLLTMKYTYVPFNYSTRKVTNPSFRSSLCIVMKQIIQFPQTSSDFMSNKFSQSHLINKQTEKANLKPQFVQSITLSHLLFFPQNRRIFVSN